MSTCQAWWLHYICFSSHCVVDEIVLFVFCREAISAVCERRGVDVDSINVYLEQSRTPLPLLTTETAWLGGRNIRIRGMDLKMHANLHYLYFYQTKTVLVFPYNQ